MEREKKSCRLSPRSLREGTSARGSPHRAQLCLLFLLRLYIPRRNPPDGLVCGHCLLGSEISTLVGSNSDPSFRLLGEKVDLRQRETPLTSWGKLRRPCLMAWMKACLRSLIQRPMAIIQLLSLERRFRCLFGQYVIGESKDGDSSSISIRIFNKSMGKWVTPIVLGTKPVLCESHSAMLLGEDRVLVVKQNASLDDCVWFLEVDTPFIKEQKRTLDTEVVAWSRGVEGDGPKPIVISGPSGVGKGTLISRLMKEFPSTFGFSVSHTTRSPRENEKDGVHYHFTQKSAMEKDIRDGKFLEYASVHGNLYGTSIEAVEVVTDEGKRCILDIDVQGARSVRTSSLEAIFIFICPPSFEELEKRLRSRGTETEEQVQKRLRNARAELEQGKTLGLFDHLLVNDDLETCYASLKKILGLDALNAPVYQSATKTADLPLYHFISKSDQRILIQSGTAETGNGSGAIYTIDVASLKGGAPGRTRGLKIHAVEHLSDGIKEL